MMDGRVMRKVAALQLGTCEYNRPQERGPSGGAAGAHQGMRQGYGGVDWVWQGCDRGTVGVVGVWGRRGYGLGMRGVAGLQ